MMAHTTGCSTRRSARKSKLVMLTVSDADVDLFSALRAGADGYLTKTTDLGLLPGVLRRLDNGEPAIQPMLLNRILERFRDGDPRRRRLAADGEVAQRLTSREWEVLELLTRNCSTAEIAGRLFISKSAVRVHIAALVNKLGVEDRAQAITLFRDRLPPD